MAGISDKAVKTRYAENKYRFNGGSELQNKEFNDGSGLDTYDANFRMYDPQIGRFWQLDPLADLGESWSPYSFVLDNPISLIDPLGMDTTCPGCMPQVVVTPPATPNRSTVNVGPADTKGGEPALPLTLTPPEFTLPLTVVPPDPMIKPIQDPVPEFPPIINPATVATGILVGIPITGNTNWPNGDEMFYHKYP